MKSETAETSSGLFQKVIFIVFLLISIHSFEIRYIPKYYNLQNMGTYAMCLFAFIMVAKQNGLRFKWAIIIFIFGIFCNSIAAYLNLEQSPIRTLLSFEFYYFILLYFLFHYLKIERKFLENTIIVFALVYVVIFIIEYRGLLGLKNILYRDVSTAVEEKQLEIVGHGFLMLGFYFVLNRYMVKYRFLDIFLAMIFFVVLLKSGFRTLIAGAVIVAAVMVLRLVKLGIRDFALFFFLIIIVAVMSQNKQVVKVYTDLVTKTQGNIKEGDKYIRYMELEFFYKIYPENPSYFIIGGGKPSGANLDDNSKGAQGFNYNIVWVDIGLLGFYMVIGGITLLGLLMYTIRAMFIKLPRDALYLNFYFIYLFLVSFTNEEIYRNGIFTIHAIALYMIDLILNEKALSANKISGEKPKELSGT